MFDHPGGMHQIHDRAGERLIAADQQNLLRTYKRVNVHANSEQGKIQGPRAGASALAPVWKIRGVLFSGSVGHDIVMQAKFAQGGLGFFQFLF